jgi:DeoR/GlpR family transcriptional regulator of sugar metabolism
MNLPKQSIEKLKRKIKLLITLSNSKAITIDDLAVEFNVETLTIKRDLCFFRSLGFKLHSTKNVGVELTEDVDVDKLSEFLSTVEKVERMNLSDIKINF